MTQIDLPNMTDEELIDTISAIELDLEECRLERDRRIPTDKEIYESIKTLLSIAIGIPAWCLEP